MSQNILPSLRMSIRKKIKMLLSENVDVAGRVYTSRPNPIILKQVPCCLVYFNDDDALLDIKPRSYQRTLQIVINFLCRFSSSEYSEDWLDSREFETIRLLQNDKNKFLGFEGFIERSFVGGTVPTIIDDEGDQYISSNQIMYMIQYRDDLGASTLILNNFLKLYAEWELKEDPNVMKAKDLINVQE